MQETKVNFSDYLHKSRSLEKSNSMQEVKIAFLSNFTINGLPEILKTKLHPEEIWVDYYNAPYNQHLQEIINTQSGLYGYNLEQRKMFVLEKIEELENLLAMLQERSKAKIVINDFVVPAYSSRGIIESKQEYGLTESIHKINESLRNICMDNNRLFTFPLNSFCSHHNPPPLAEPKIAYLTDMKISSDGLIGLAFEYTRFVYLFSS